MQNGGFISRRGGKMTKHYVNKNGDYLGAFSGYKKTDANGKVIKEFEPKPENAIEVKEPPQDGRQKYDLASKKWLPLELDYTEKRITIEPKYKPIEDQLDLLYWDMKNGTENWIKHID